MKKNIVLLQETVWSGVTRAAAAILRESAQEFNHQFEFEEFPIGGAAIDAAGTPLPMKRWTAAARRRCILGSGRRAKVDALPVGAPREWTARSAKRPGALRHVRPVKLLEPLRGISP